MRKVLTLAVFVFMAICVTNAQNFVGGSINFSTSGQNNSANGPANDTHSTSFTFNPKGGVYLSNDMLLGLQLSVGVSRNSNGSGNSEVVTKSSSFGLAPFVRYHAVRFNKFSVFAQGQVGLGFGATETESNGISVKGPKSTSFYFSVFPGVAYDLSEKFALEASINVFNFGYNYTKFTERTGNPDTRTTNNFGLGVNMNNIVKVGDITIGAIFRF